MKTKNKVPFMGRVFELIEKNRAGINEKTPFIKDVDIESDVVYKTINGKNLVIDIYKPKNKPTGLSPAVFIIPGGAWLIHNLKRRGGYASLFTALGATVFIADYRVSPEIRFPEHVWDVVDAFDFVYENADKYGIDVNNVVVTGDSAGGQLSACLACCATTPSYAEQIGVPVPKITPAGCIFVSGSFSFDTMCRIPVAHTFIAKPFSGLRTKTAFKKWKFYKESNPMNFITEKFPPSYNSGGKYDLFCQGDAKKMSEILTSKGVKNEYFVGEGIRDDHCYVLRNPYLFARKDMLKLIKWYVALEKEKGEDMSEPMMKVEEYLTNPAKKYIPEQ